MDDLTHLRLDAWRTLLQSSPSPAAAIPPGARAPTLSKSGRTFHTTTCPASPGARQLGWTQVIERWAKPHSRLSPCPDCAAIDRALIAWIDARRLLANVTRLVTSGYGRSTTQTPFTARSATSWLAARDLAFAARELLETDRFAALTGSARAQALSALERIGTVCADGIATLDCQLLDRAALAAVIAEPVGLRGDHALEDAWRGWLGEIAAGGDGRDAATAAFGRRVRGGGPFIADRLDAWDRLFNATLADWASFPLHAAYVTPLATRTASDLLAALDDVSWHGTAGDSGRPSPRLVGILPECTALTYTSADRRVVGLPALWVAALCVARPGTIDCGPLTGDEVRRWTAGDLPESVIIAAGLTDTVRTGGDLLDAARAITGA